MTKTRIKAAAVALLTLTLTAAIACGSDNVETPTADVARGSNTPTPTLDVVTTIYPLTYFAEQIGGDRVQITPMIKPGVDAHDFEPTPGDILTISDADVLLYNHPAFEGWIDGAIEAANNSGLIAVKTADLPDDVELAHDHGDEHEGHDDDEHGHDEHGGDEHEHGDDKHSEEEELIDAIDHVIEEVEDGDISADEGIEEIEELVGGHGHEDEGSEDEHGHEDEHVEGLKAEILEIVEQVEAGSLPADEGIEQIETLIGGHAHDEDDEHGHDDDGHDEHGHDEEKELVDAIGHVIEEVEDGDITADQGIEEIEELAGDHGHEDEGSEDEHGREDEHVEELKADILVIVKQVEAGSMPADEGIEQIETLIGGHAHDEHDDHAHDEDDEHGHDDDHEGENGHNHDHGGEDPHVWLNPIEATEQVRAIQQAFSNADPAGVETYRANADDLVARLLELDGEIGEALNSCTLDHIVVSHEAYGHLAERYGLEQIGLADLSAEFDSTPRRIAEIIDEMRSLGVSHILQEPILSADLAETVAAETDAEVLPLHPLESLTPAEQDAGEDYFSIMRANLESLRTALGCS